MDPQLCSKCSKVVGKNILHPPFVGGVVLSACWPGGRSSLLTVDDSEGDWELEEGGIVSSKAESTGVEHRSS